MKFIPPFINSFRVKVTLTLIFSLLFIAGLDNFILYEYNLRLQFKNLQDKLKTIASTAAIDIDADLIGKVPLNREGINSQAYETIAEQLNKIKKANPQLKYIYTLAKTGTPGIAQFIVDPSPYIGTRTSLPGDKYDAYRFPEMLEAYGGPTVDKNLVIDEWGATLSAYAPIYGKNLKAVAILGVDIDANEVYTLQKAARLKTLFILILVIAVSILLGAWISMDVTRPVQNLVEGTRRIAAGNLDYKVEIKSKDEIGELAEAFNAMAGNLAASREKLHDYFYRVVQAMVRSLEAKDHYTRGHSDRVSEYSADIAKAIGFSDEKVEMLKKAAQLHDIGKLGIHEDILNKKSALSENEWDLIHQHPAVGEEILKPIFLDEEMLAVVRSHHERYDGKGYPDGLKAEQINIFAQIVCVADSYDAMTSSRSYRAALSKEEAIERLKKDCGAQFNPEIVEAFIKVL
ncbi:MAG: HD domain-containing protein [Candidatus Omnitrophica bacterium]|jgi:HD-GYP domain-containing protein (c-di-GMP phosphodiesterase class II)|nr:HD domain-containing protein [Candidatus Omnitrophota bacterium]